VTTTTYCINPSSAVVHTWLCQIGPASSRTVGGYQPLPSVVLDYLPSRLFCHNCCPHLGKQARAREGQVASSPG